MDLDYSVAQIKLTSSICTSVAILATVIRLFARRLVPWFDDVCALLSMLSVVAQMGIVLTIKSPDSFFAPHFLIGTMFYFTVWFARLSILLTIIRIGLNLERSRYLFAAVVVFLILLSLLVGQLYWICEPQKEPSNGICIPTNQLAIFKLVSDVIADLILLTSSFRLFLVIQDKALRFRLYCLFSTCIATTALSLVNSALVLKSQALKIIVVALVEASVSLIVANVPVLSSLFPQMSEPTSHGRGRRGLGVASIIHFVHPTNTRVSGTSSIEMAPTPVIIIKTSPADIMT